MIKYYYVSGELLGLGGILCVCVYKNNFIDKMKEIYIDTLKDCEGRERRRKRYILKRQYELFNEEKAELLFSFVISIVIKMVED